MAIIYLITGTICIAFAPILVKLSSLSPSQVGFYRCFIAFFALLPFIKVDWQYISWPKRYKLFSLAFLGGMAFSLDLFSWHIGIHKIGAGMATILANTQVFFAAIIGYFFLKEKLSRSFFFFSSLALLGLYLLVVPESWHFEKDYSLGIMFSLLAGLLYSIFLNFFKKIDQDFHEYTNIAFRFLLICASTSFGFSLIMPFDAGFAVPANSTEWLWVGLLAIAVHIGGWIFIGKSFSSLPMRKVSLVLLLQPVLASIISNILFQESFSSKQILGAGITLVAIYFGQRR